MKSHAESQSRREDFPASFPPSASLRLCVSLLCFVLGLRVAAADEPPKTDLAPLVGLLELVIEADADSAKECLQTLGAKIRSGEADEATLAELKKRLAPPLAKILAGKADDPLAADAALVAALWRDEAALQRVRAMPGDS